MNSKMLLVFILQIASNLALESSYFEQISFEKLGKRRFLKSLNDTSTINCAQRCKRDLGCFNIAFQQKSSNNGLCILLTKLKPATCTQTENGEFVIKGAHSGYYNIEKLCKTENVPENVKIEEPEYFDPKDYDNQSFVMMKKRPQFEFASCSQAFEQGEQRSGLYFIADLGWHYCNMDTLDACGSGGWTLAMLADGNQPEFKFNSDYWEYEDLLNDTEALKDPLSISAKYEAFNFLSFKSICLGMKHGGERTGYLKIPVAYDSLGYFFHDNTKFFQTNESLSAWTKLIDMPDMTDKCPSRQGFNMMQNYGSFRIGIATNENDCSVSFSSTIIGVGIGHQLWCHKSKKDFSAGYQFCSPVNGPHHLKPALTYIYVK